MEIGEITLHPRTGVFPRPEWNGTGITHLGLYDDPNLNANVALLAVHMDDEQAKKGWLAAKIRIGTAPDITFGRHGNLARLLVVFG